MIERNLVQYWDKKEVPSEVANLMKTWGDKNPGMTHTVFNKDTASEYILSNYGTFVHELFQSARLPAMQSDIFRIAFCLREGGFYADAASSCDYSIEPLISDLDSLLLMRRLKGTICNGFIAAPKNHPVVFMIWNVILKNLFTKDIERVWLATGPGTFKGPLDQCDDSQVTIVEQADMKEKYFRLIGNLPHKGKEHWSTAQKTQSIFEVDGI